MKRGKPIKILTGQRFGRLLVIGIHRHRIKNHVAWDCLCDCGNLNEGVMGSNIARTQSCGCYARELRTTHNQTKAPEYRTYATAKSRCNDVNATSYKNYGGRGIEFRFNSFEEFYAELGAKPSKKHTIDRINNDGHYEKGNVKWATYAEQALNKRSNRRLTWRGVTKTITEWAAEVGLSIGAINHRIRIGWTIDRTLREPSQRRYG